MNDDVALADQREDVGVVVLKTKRRHRRPLRPAHFWNIEIGDLVDGAPVERAIGFVEVVFAELQFLFEKTHDAIVGPRTDLEPHHAGKAPLAQLLLNLLEQVLGVLVVTLGFGVAGDAERQNLENFHARKQVVEIVGDDVLQRDEAAGRAETEELSAELGHFHAREERFALTRSAQQHSQRHRHVGDEGKAVPRINGKRRENRKDVAAIPAFSIDALGVGEFVPAQKVDRFALELRQQQLAKGASGERGLLKHALADQNKLLLRRERFPRRASNASVNLPTQSADALHKKLVEV